MSLNVLNGEQSIANLMLSLGGNINRFTDRKQWLNSDYMFKRVEVSAENLNIESLQNTAKYEGKQESASGQATVGYGVSAGGSYSKSKVNSNYASVKTQAGIYAGDEGYDVDVKEHTELTGALMTSTKQAEVEKRNRVSTGTLNATDIENHANYKGSSIGVSGSTAMNFDTPLGNSENGIAQSNKQAVNEKGEKIYLDSQGNETTEAKTGGQANQAKLATGLASLTSGGNIGYGSDSDSQHSQTKSGINTANIDIRDSQGQLEKTGRTVDETRTQLNTDITTENAENRSGVLNNNFDKAQVQKELDYQVKATSEFQSITLTQVNKKANEHAEKLRQEANHQMHLGNVQEAERLKQEAENWEVGGKYRQALSAVTNGIGLALGGVPTEGIVAGAVSPYVNTEIKKVTEGNDTANILAHGVWGAIEAATQGRNALSSATAAITGEVGAKVLSNVLYGQDNPKNLTNEQKEMVSSLSQQLAGIASGATSLATGSNSVTAAQNATAGMGIAKNAVENNYLFKNEAARKYELEQKARKGIITPAEQQELDEINQLDKARDIKLVSSCVDKMSSMCREESKQVDSAKISYSGSELSHVYAYPVYTAYSTKYEDDYKKAASFSEQYSILTASKEKAYADFEARFDLPKGSVNQVTQWSDVIANTAGLIGTSNIEKSALSGDFSKGVPKEVNSDGKLDVVGETANYKTNKINFSGLEIEMSKQNKHLRHTNEYKVAMANNQKKSIITVDLDSLKGYAGTGQQVGKLEVGLPGSKERINFNKIIGDYIDPITGQNTPTKIGIIHYSKNGYHIVPAKPNEN